MMAYSGGPLATQLTQPAGPFKRPGPCGTMLRMKIVIGRKMFH